MVEVESLRQEIQLDSGEVVPVLPIDQFVADLSAFSTPDRLGGSLQLMGCEFWDTDDDPNRYIKGAAVSLVSIGGLAVAKADETPDQIRDRLTSFSDSTHETMALSATMSYLNPGDKLPQELYDTVTRLGHFSIAHTVSVGVMVGGITTGVECEFDTQRDLVHLSRITVARTNLQTRPPIAVPEERLLAATKQIVAATDAAVGVTRKQTESREAKLDQHEAVNLLYPSSKATALFITGTLRNFGKLVDQRDDSGKEREYREALYSIRGALQPLWPELFNR